MGQIAHVNAVVGKARNVNVVLIAHVTADAINKIKTRFKASFYLWAMLVDRKCRGAEICTRATPSRRVHTAAILRPVFYFTQYFCFTELSSFS